MKVLPFIKMHGLGNDYVYIDCFQPATATLLAHTDIAALARRISDRHLGVGSDGLVLIMPARKADVRMRMFNADGSEAQMCGNAARCVAKYAYEHDLCTNPMTLETASGVRRLWMELSASQRVNNVMVEMVVPEINRRTLTLGSEVQAYVYVNIGNPHAVIFVDQLPNDQTLNTLGPLWEKHPDFPEGTNVEFVQMLNPHELRMRVWERGTGETMACGTGACAAAVAAMRLGKAERELTVHLRLGDLYIQWPADDKPVYLTGPATEVYRGEYFME